MSATLLCCARLCVWHTVFDCINPAGFSGYCQYYSYADMRSGTNFVDTPDLASKVSSVQLCG